LLIANDKGGTLEKSGMVCYVQPMENNVNQKLEGSWGNDVEWSGVEFG